MDINDIKEELNQNTLRRDRNKKLDEKITLETTT